MGITPTAAVLVAAFGFALLVVGVAFVYWPAALMVAGGLLFAAGLVVETR